MRWRTCACAAWPARQSWPTMCCRAPSVASRTPSEQGCQNALFGRMRVGVPQQGVGSEVWSAAGCKLPQAAALPCTVLQPDPGIASPALQDAPGCRHVLKRAAPGPAGGLCVWRGLGRGGRGPGHLPLPLGRPRLPAGQRAGQGLHEVSGRRGCVASRQVAWLQLHEGAGGQLPGRAFCRRFCGGTSWLLPRYLPCRLADLLRPPAWRDVAPMLRSGAFLSTRSILAMGGCIALTAPDLCLAHGATLATCMPTLHAPWLAVDITLRFGGSLCCCRHADVGHPPHRRLWRCGSGRWEDQLASD